MPTPADNPSNAIVYMDYENIQELFRRYDKDLLDINFFPVILAKFKRADLKLVDFIVYGNFEKGSAQTKQQTHLRTLGLQTRHSSNNGKNSSDLELTVDALRTLYKMSGIDLYILITSDRDIIPLLKAIRFEGKLSCVLSTRIGFNQIVADYADLHEFLEDIFGLTGLAPVVQKSIEPEPLFDAKTLTGADIDRAKEAARLLYSSHIWQRAVQLGEPVSLTGYTQAIAKAINYRVSDILESFKIAHTLEFITIYHGPNQRLFIKEGPRKADCI
jgi:uncharacterized LabA/DUF88 family protein